MKIRIILGAIFTLSMMVFSQMSFAARCDTLKPGQAAFFQHGKYKGVCVVRKVGRYSNSAQMGIANDKISSIKLGQGTQVKLCNHNNFKGACEVYTKNTPGLGRMNDKTSSAIIEKIAPTKGTSVRCKPNAYQIAVYEHANYKGACAVLGVGNYRNSNAIGVVNDTISSVLVGKNVAIVDYKDTGFVSVNIYSDKDVPVMFPSSSKNPLKKTNKHADHPNSSDEISSIKVIKVFK
jgi:hypothetical protein